MLQSLKSRIIVLLILANIPAVIFAVVMGVLNYGDARALQQLAVVQAAEVLAARTAQVFNLARGVISTLTLDPGFAQDQALCAQRLSSAIATAEPHIGAFIAGEDGQLICSAGVGPNDAEDRAALTAIVLQSARADVVFLAETTTTMPRVVAAQRLDIGGRQAVLALAIDRAAFDVLFGQTMPLPHAAAIVTGDGQVLATDPLSDSPNWRPVMAMASVRTMTDFVAPGADGVMRYFVATPVPFTDAYVLAARPWSVIRSLDTWQLLTTLGVPLAMTAFGILALLIGLNLFVLRWIRRLRVTAFDYAAGEYDVRVEGMDKAPREIAELGDAFNTMAAAITDRSDALERALAEKDQILRELHHRVKNNFQMIASLLGLQRRELPAEVRPLLRVPEDRVLAMAAAYKASYATGEIGHVQVLELLSDVGLQIRQSFGARAPKITVEAAEDITLVALDLDRAVPLALLVSELVSAALRRDDQSDILITIMPEEGETDGLRIEIAAPGINDTLPRSALPGRLVTAYVAQLHGRLDTERPDMLAVMLPRSALTDASPKKTGA